MPSIVTCARCRMGVRGGGGGVLFGLRIDFVLAAVVGVPTTNGMRSPRRTLASLDEPLIALCEVAHHDGLLPLIDSVAVLRSEWQYVGERVGGILRQVCAHREHHAFLSFHLEEDSHPHTHLEEVLLALHDLYEMARQCQKEQAVAFLLTHPDHSRATRAQLKAEVTHQLQQKLWRLSIEVVEMHVDLQSHAATCNCSDYTCGASMADAMKADDDDMEETVEEDILGPGVIEAKAIEVDVIEPVPAELAPSPPMLRASPLMVPFHSAPRGRPVIAGRPNAPKVWQFLEGEPPPKVYAHRNYFYQVCWTTHSQSAPTSPRRAAHTYPHRHGSGTHAHVSARANSRAPSSPRMAERMNAHRPAPSFSTGASQQSQPGPLTAGALGTRPYHTPRRAAPTFLAGRESGLAARGRTHLSSVHVISTPEEARHLLGPDWSSHLLNMVFSPTPPE